jgi:hypothetical protein
MLGRAGELRALLVGLALPGEGAPGAPGADAASLGFWLRELDADGSRGVDEREFYVALSRRAAPRRTFSAAPPFGPSRNCCAWSADGRRCLARAALTLGRWAWSLTGRCGGTHAAALTCQVGL